MEIAIIIALILLNGVFAMSEIALISARKSSLSNDIRHGSSTARIALKLANDPDKFLSTIQIGITLIGILTGIYSGDVLAADLGKILINAGVPATYAYLLAQILIVILVTYLTIIFGELVPKRIGMSVSTRAAKLLARPMYWLSIIASPFVWLLAKSTSLIFNLLHINTAEEKVTEEEIRSMIDEGTENGEVQEVEQDIMERALALGDQTVEQLMTHRSDITFLDMDMTAQEIEKIITEDTHAAYPVIGDDPDEVMGIITVKDLIPRLWKKDFSLKQILQKPLYFPENMTAYKALEELKRSKFNRALVVDEFGSVQGIIVLRDIMEGLVGQIPDYSEAPDIFENADHSSWTVSGQCQFYDFLAYFDEEDLYTPDYNTVGGLILDLLEHIPTVGEKVEWNNFMFRVTSMDGTRINNILVRKKAPENKEEE